jgi:hypothetical protein
MRKLIVIIVFLFASACGNDTTEQPDGGTSNPDGGTQKVCGTGSQHEQIINAATTSEALQKTPTHPPIGPGGLP